MVAHVGLESHVCFGCMRHQFSVSGSSVFYHQLRLFQGNGANMQDCSVAHVYLSWF